MSAPEKPFATRFCTTTLSRPGSRDCCGYWVTASVAVMWDGLTTVAAAQRCFADSRTSIVVDASAAKAAKSQSLVTAAPAPLTGVATTAVRLPASLP